jgi:hypothetical protein
MTLSAELFDLWRMGTTQLPNLSRQFQAAADALDGADDRSRYDRPSDIGYATIGQNMWLWISQLESIADKEAQNLDQLGQALVRLSHEYARVDAETAADFDTSVASYDPEDY